MYDNWHEDWRRADAEQVVKAGRRCEDCPDPGRCATEGACINHLKLAQAGEE